MLPLLCRVVEDGYGRSCGFSWLIEHPIVSKLELEPSMSGPSPRKVVLDAPYDSSFLWWVGCRYGERCVVSVSMRGLIVSTMPTFGSSYWNQRIIILSSSPHKRRQPTSGTLDTRITCILSSLQLLQYSEKNLLQFVLAWSRKRTHFTRKPLMKTHWSWVMVEFCPLWN